jgi:hypothetical protein
MRMSGMTLVSVLFMLVGILTLTGILFFSVFVDLQTSSNVAAGDDALYVAEAGIHHLWSILEPASDFAEALAWPAGEPPFGSPVGFPRPPRSYRVTVSAGSGGSLRAVSEGTSHRGARRKVEARFLRDDRFRPAATLTLGSSTSFGEFSGALDVSADETNAELPALGAESREVAAAASRARDGSVQTAVVGASGLGPAASRLGAEARVTLDGARSGETYGTAEDPVVVRFAGDTEISGVVHVTGIVVADAPIHVVGRLEIDGLLLAPSGIDVGGELAVSGAAWIAGQVELAASGRIDASYARAAVDRAERAGGAALPRGAVLRAWREIW